MNPNEKELFKDFSDFMILYIKKNEESPQWWEISDYWPDTMDIMLVVDNSFCFSLKKGA